MVSTDGSNVNGTSTSTPSSTNGAASNVPPLCSGAVHANATAANHAATHNSSSDRAGTSGGETPFLPALTAATRVLHSQGPAMRTLDFTIMVDRMIVALDYLGFVMGYAKSDALTKNSSLKAVAGQFPLLRDIVESDRKAGRLTVKNSCGRNLHRLMHVVTFLRLVLQNLARSPDTTLHSAVSTAYEIALAPIHTYMVRTAVWAGLYALPTREAFLTHIGETEETARSHAGDFVAAAEAITAHIGALYGEAMPPSDTMWVK